MSRFRVISTNLKNNLSLNPNDLSKVLITNNKTVCGVIDIIYYIRQLQRIKQKD